MKKRHKEKLVWQTKVRSRKGSFFSYTLFALGILTILGTSPYLYGLWRVSCNYRPAKMAILVLGGSDGSREKHALLLWQRLNKQHEQPTKTHAGLNNEPCSGERDIKVWISTGRPVSEIQQMIEEIGVNKDCVILDYRAIDTVTNFTTLSKKIALDGVTHSYVVTDVTHIRRAMIIASVILTYYGIHPIDSASANTTNREFEWAIRAWRDYLRSVIWFYTGKSGAHLIALTNWRKIMRRFY